MNTNLSNLKQNIKKGFIGKILPITLAGSIDLSSGLPSKKAYAYNLEVPTISAQEFEEYKYTKMFLGGRQIEFTKETGAPYKKSKRLMVPLKAFAEACYSIYEYNDKEKVAELKRYDKTINVKEKSKKLIIKTYDYSTDFLDIVATLNSEKSMKANVKTTIKNGIVYVQLSTLAKALGFSVRTDKKTGIIHVEYKDNFKNIDFKEKKLISIKNVNENSFDKIMFDWAEVSNDYLSVLKKSNQYKVFVEDRVLYVFSYQMLNNLDVLYGANKEVISKALSSNSEEESRTYLPNIPLYKDKSDYYYMSLKNANILELWISDYWYKNRDLELSSSMYGEDKHLEAMKVAKKIADDIKSQNLSEHDQVLAACNKISEICDYTSGRYSYNALIEGNAACAGYQGALSLILYYLQIPCVNIFGYNNGGGHAWNHVYVNNKWYIFDVSSYDYCDNNRFLFNSELESKGFFGYTYESESERDDIKLIELTYKFY